MRACNPLLLNDGLLGVWLDLELPQFDMEENRPIPSERLLAWHIEVPDSYS